MSDGARAIGTGRSTRQCKLCGSRQARYRFTVHLVADLVGEYYECDQCGLLQSYHLDSLTPQEVQRFYACTPPDLDSGAEWRQHCVLARLRHLTRLGFRPQTGGYLKALDFGSGSGFVVDRLGLGYHAIGYDPYTEPTHGHDRIFQDWSEIVRRGPYDLVVASEVLEHFAQPADTLSRLRTVMAPQCMLYVTTGRYRPGQRTEDWTYLAPASGQHVAFYSQRSMEQVARLLGAWGVLNVGAEYEWLLVRGTPPPSAALRMRFLVGSFLLRKAVQLGIVDKIE